MRDIRAGLLRGAAATALSVAVLLPGATSAVAASPPTGTLLYAPAGQAVKDSYIVVLKEEGELKRDKAAAGSSVDATARRLAEKQKGRVGRVYTHALQGFEVSLDEAAAKRLAADPAVAYVEQNSRMYLQDVQPNPPSWGLDRIDQRDYRRDRSYTYPTSASDMTVYVIDSGIQATNVDFFWFRVTQGASMIAGQAADQDCHGHGTHVASTIGGFNYGVAKGVTLVPVKVFDCIGNSTAATIMSGMDWVYFQHNFGERAIVNMSLSGGPSNVVDDAARRMLNDGLVVVAAAGNRTDFVSDACLLSPARVADVITVASMGNTDLIDGFSNGGACVDVYAPGSGINAAYHLYDWASTIMDGTSMASAHAAGAAAILWSLHPSLNRLQITRLLVQTAFHGAGWHPGSKPDPALYVQPVVPGPLPLIRTDRAYPLNMQLTAAGGGGPYTWSATGLPATVTLTPSGLLSGRVLLSTDTLVKVTATDATGQSGTVTERWRVWREACPTC